MRTSTKWLTGHEFESRQEENIIRVDGNKKNGFSPKALLLSGLAGCSGIDVVDILGKMRVSFNEFIIDVEAEQTSEHPKVFTKVDITYRISTKAANEDKVRKAIELSLEKYCGVSAMLKKNSPVRYELVILS